MISIFVVGSLIVGYPIMITILVQDICFWVELFQLGRAFELDSVGLRALSSLGGLREGKRV